ncbi:dTDP-4-amino-4,6-dideoxygalactose transaminase [Flavobacterium psychrophilum]|jgi:dTDP-4-amino-4,6-dideoxygalactose transaminase|uniref:dTDP-4-amino-4,6-dideoxygalactose transaminase n=1 Tax=Flavobacterium psychrophilum TaxID=96345 RepID=A0A8G2FYT9_FLAPS|nr:dTDP-4-amino-4,6-dideoxygalactose transaminase [Flavobacterium psychrophilum]AIN73477.1 TDP-4-oxo-6-deoxy-D-glucose aminotransferase [Flavobacterium psychrophilum FPG3]EKT2069394.1 dTDP-4-amino-4,6-dideoxygalactose transaminase [Flavobacterium psychrophilum]EKT2071658.1 dTDP-4-amino-4,6-dideoxygalactose transaminase [Flavobacterium psychrophilum]EKT3962626.1 dTDP-4-amino-4,6-dideoxygalactose transaminase [Flavobacterium psychrophilum]EKT4491179.1 dTDP-4-amino-4,6-dideoxygalactose transamina
MIPFNKPFLTGKETIYIEQAVQSGKLSGNGNFTQKCQQFFEDKYKFKKCLLTTSCTDALEMCAMLINCNQDDEIIVPSYTFVSSALAFVRQGAKIIFADSQDNNPNIDANKIEHLITPKTKAIVVVHYAGIAADMDKIMQLAHQYNLVVIEDAAQAIDSFYKGKPLGSIGHLAAFSFHETKNVISGEGGMLAINDDKYIARAEVIWEKGTNRASFFRGEINKYGWVDTGSSFLPSEVIAAFLWAQLENLELIQEKRKAIWNTYYNTLKSFEKEAKIKLPIVPDYASNNGHLFYLICNSIDERTDLINKLKNNNIHAVFHYISLHSSDYYSKTNEVPALKWSDYYTDRLLRLPLFFELTEEQVIMICNTIIHE